jgi:hypothetical protein
MKAVRLTGRALRMLVCVCTAFVLAAGAAQAARPLASASLSAHKPPHGAARAPITLAHSHVHGVVYRRGSVQAQRVKADCFTSCAGPLFYLGGPVMHNPKAYAIFWEPLGTKFPVGYEHEIERFMEAVELSSSKPLNNVFSVDFLYGDTEEFGDYGWGFGGGLPNTDALPVRDTSHCPIASLKEEEEEAEGGFGLPPAGEPCVTDAQIQAELKSFVKNKGLQSGLGNLYFLFTPPTVNSCAGGSGATAECTTNAYCAYHFDVASENPHIIYANMPWGDRPGCATPDQPNSSPADDEIDLVNHEGNEAITDPLGGEEGVEKAGWLAYSGNEVADLCTYPFFDPLVDFNAALDAYGELLGGAPATYNEGEIAMIGTAYNQVLAGGHYLLQREWSDAAEGCVARAPIPVPSFSVYSSPGTAGQPVSFDGSGSTAGAGQLVFYEWDLGDGTTVSEVPTVTHTYATAGKYIVKLTIANDSGAAVTTEREITIGEPAPHPAPLVLTVREPVAPSHLTAAELATKLGLPANGKKLSGKGPFPLGHAECPPACGVGLQLFAKVTSGRGRHRSTKFVLIGSAHMTFAAKGAGALSLSLNAKGKALLRKKRALACRLVVTVEGQEGGTWQIVRLVRLTNGGSAARHARR